MNNYQIAKILRNISLILEMKGGDRFRPIAYEKAADTVMNITQDLNDIYKQGGVKALDQIENIGESISEKIEELIKTGKMKYYHQLLRDIPEPVLDLTDVPGIGAKTALALWKKLKIDSIAKLEKAAKEHKISKLEHFREKAEENILRGIEQYRIRTKERNRMILTQAEPIALDVIDYLKKNKLIIKCEPVGSLRRMKETIGDIDIVAATPKPRLAVNYLAEAPFVKSVLVHGTTKLSFNHSSNVRVDLEILPQSDWGTLLQHFTGSKDHNVHLRTWAEKNDMKISEYGVRNLKLKKTRHFENEKDFYVFLGMQYIPPEMREDTGEIEAALAHKLPKIIEYGAIKGDLHTHTNLSDGADTIETMIAGAKKLKYEYYGISDHTVGLGVASGLSEKALLKHAENIHKIAKKFPGMKVLAGAEVNIKADGSLDIGDKILSRLDYAIGSVHTAFNQDKETMTKRILKAVKNPNIRFLGHPTGRLLGERHGYDADWLEIFKACARYNVALEINAYPNRLDLRDTLVKEALSYGCKLIINTDSHSVDTLTNMHYGISVARRGWATSSDVVNSWSLGKFMFWLRKR